MHRKPLSRFDVGDLQVKEILLQKFLEVEQTAKEQATDNAILDQLYKVFSIIRSLPLEIEPFSSISLLRIHYVRIVIRHKHLKVVKVSTFISKNPQSHFCFKKPLYVLILISKDPEVLPPFVKTMPIFLDTGFKIK